LSTRADLSRRRPRRPCDPALAAADRRSRAVRRNRVDPKAAAGRGLGSDELVLTVGELVRDLDLPVLAGDRGLDTPLRWVHISELLDPTPWLSGGELLLTTGMSLDTGER